MARYEISGTISDIFTCAEIQQALRQAGAKRISKRRAFGLSNQPYVATFAATSDLEANRICTAAELALPRETSAFLIPYKYAE